MRNLFLLLSFSFCAFLSCKKDEGPSKEITYVKSISLDSVEVGTNFQRIQVTDEGHIFLNTQGPAMNSWSTIYKYNSEGVFEGCFVDTLTSSTITFYNFFIDHNNNISLFSLTNYGNSQIRTYKIDGTFLTSQSLSSLSDDNVSDLFFGHWNFAFDSEENVYGVSSNTAGIYNEIVKINADYTTKLLHLKVEDIKEFFPNQNGEQVRLTDIAIDENDKVYITVDRIAEDGDSDKDGVLILDNNLQFISFFGKDWAFNGPSSICFDNNYMYVLNMYHKDIDVFDENMKQVAIFANQSDNYVLNSPVKIMVKEGYVYVLDYKNGEKVINIFEAL